MDRPPADLTSPDDGRRPRDLALLLLAIGTDPPRARARDQQADLAGGDLLRRVLDRLAALDPEPDAIEATLSAIVAEIGAPSGPTRGVCSLLLQEWEQTRISTGSWPWLISEALESTEAIQKETEGNSTNRKRKRNTKWAN